MKKIWYSILVMCISLTLFSCCRDTNEEWLEQALVLSGSNRVELEKVLHYYSKDAQKLEAAKFLIRNMPGHFSYCNQNAINRYESCVDSIIDRMKGEKDYNKIRDSIDCAAIRLGIDTLHKVQDCQIVTAEFLIQNIDQAFKEWKEGKWARHLSFEEFCEWILPYKVEELQPLDDWRSRLQQSFRENLENLDLCDQLRHSPLAAAKLLNKTLADTLKPVTGLSVAYPNMLLEKRLRIPFGQCNDYANMAATYMRSFGIPVVVYFTPQWAKRSMGHTWNVIMSEDGRLVSFGGIGDAMDRYHKMEEKLSKVYMRTYSPNTVLQEMNNSHEFVPEFFQDLFMRDVTSSVISSSDVTLKIEPELAKSSKHAFLCNFDNHEWIPVAYGAITDGKVTFHGLGRNVLYLPIIYKGGIITPISHPIILAYDGTVREIIPEVHKKETLVLSRKYPVMEYAYPFIERMKDGEFQASNDVTFQHSYLVHCISEMSASGKEVVVPDSIPPCRYWRYINNRPATFCSIAEIMLFPKCKGEKVTGKVIGTDGSWGDNPAYTKEKVFDGDVLTSFDAPRGEGCWVGLDLGKPTTIDRIIYYCRCDGNSVEIGDEYELLFWAFDHWESLGRQLATRLQVKYVNVPPNGLYLLRDHTKGIDERIFTIEEGKQVWW